MDERLAQLVGAYLESGPASLYRLLDLAGGDPAAISALDPEAAGMPAGLAAAVRSGTLHSRGARELEALERIGGHAVCLSDPAHPAAIDGNRAVPPVLFVLGELRSGDYRGTAVVGSRRSDRYGLDMARRIGGEVAGQGGTVISGLAAGIDGRAHEGALGAGGRTVAVVGTGLDQIYPPEHAELAGRIAASGAVVSQFPLGTPPLRQNFPIRNRTIAALSSRVVVVRGTAGSGAIVTARLARSLGVPVLAVPGNVGDALSEGPNLLLCEGCRPFIVGGGPEAAPAARPGPEAAAGPTLEGLEAGVWHALAAGRRHVDELADGLSAGPPDLARAVLALELRGLVRRLPGDVYERA